MFCILHGYLLEGSGSNLWTRAIARSLCGRGDTVHLMAQENHPERYDFVAEALRYHPDGRVERFFEQATPYPGRCTLHKPQLGETLPVYVWDEYEEFTNVVPMIELADAEIERYLELNTRALLRIVAEHEVTAIHANHAVLMSVVAQRVGAATGIPFAIMPHGSAIEYAVKRDARFHRLASDAFTAAQRVFVIGDEMRERVRSVFPGVPDLEHKLSGLHLGVDTGLFQPIPREQRRANIERLKASVATLPRGKPAERTDRLREQVSGALEPGELRDLFAASSGYDAKAPDADLELELATVDWERDVTLLYLGRLIPAKGVQDVIAALPLLLERVPELRLLVVGHGPLREPLEALITALERGDRELVEKLVAWGAALEAAPAAAEPVELRTLRLFYQTLAERGGLSHYFELGQRHVRRDRVIFTGYLTHRELQFLFPCCDVAVFPSAVREAGPLVFLEALAAGAFPLGTYFGGMRASIDAVAAALPAEAAAAMRLSPDPERTVLDIAEQVPAALGFGTRHKEALRRVAEEHYDWKSVARRLAAELRSLG